MNIPDNIPAYRPKGSPLARAYGATNPDGTPHLAPATKARVAPTVPRQRREALSPLERAEGKRTPDRTHGAQTLQALRMAFSNPAPTPLRRVAKAKATDISDMVLVYDDNGNPYACDPDDLQSLSSGTPSPTAPAQPDPKAAIAYDANGNPLPVAGAPVVPPVAQPVAKSRRPMTLREKWAAERLARPVKKSATWQDRQGRLWRLKRIDGSHAEPERIR